MSSWGHSAGVLPETGYPSWLRERPCAAPKCHEMSTHWTSYSYVTGRAGRTSHAVKGVCVTHAQRFATKYGIEFAAAAPDPTASQQMINGFLGATS